MDPYYIQKIVSIGHTSVGLRLIQNETHISSVFRFLATTRLRVFGTLIRLEKKLFPSARRNILLTWPRAIFSVKNHLFCALGFTDWELHLRVLGWLESRQTLGWGILARLPVDDAVFVERCFKQFTSSVIRPFNVDTLRSVVRPELTRRGCRLH